MKPLRKITIAAPRALATFVAQDARILAKDFRAELVSVSGLTSLGRLCRAIAESDAVIVWFLGRHALPAIMLARAQRVPLIGIIGGFEVAWIEEIDYGIQPGSVRDRVLGWMLNQLSYIVTVSEFSRNLMVARFAKVKGRLTLVYNAVDTSVFTPPTEEVRAGVLTVATISESSIRVKNLELLKEVAAAMPDTEFNLVGPAIDETARRFVSSLPPNLVWKGQLSGDALIRSYRSASVFFLASLHESFSLALAEAMSCGCVPVISQHGALPEVGGPDALVLSGLSVDASRRAILNSLNAPDSLRKRLREHVVDRFGIGKRREVLTRLITNVCDERHETKR